MLIGLFYFIAVIAVIGSLLLLYDIARLLLRIYTNFGEKKRREQQQIMRILKKQ